jgi:hypothetical protein
MTVEGTSSDKNILRCSTPWSNKGRRATIVTISVVLIHLTWLSATDDLFHSGLTAIIPDDQSYTKITRQYIMILNQAHEILTILTRIILIRDKINGRVHDNGRVYKKIQRTRTNNGRIYNDTTDPYTTATAVNIKIQRTRTQQRPGITKYTTDAYKRRRPWINERYEREW